MSKYEFADTEYTDDAVCPHCGYHDDSIYELFRDGSECETTECARCDKPMSVTIHYEILYSTRKVDE